jgi:hypothetical protein
MQSRWETVQRFVASGTLLDYGCATGAFHTAAPDGFLCTGWDVNPESPYSRNFPHGHYDVLTMWDVMEHLDKPFQPIERFTPDWLFVCSPNALNTNIYTFTQWKHFKPQEHLHYFTPQTLAMSMRSVGYRFKYIDYSEGRLRDARNPNAIFTMVFAKCLTH